jgi:predicted nuclease with RNAse H fold
VALITLSGTGAARRASATLASEDFVASDEALIALVHNDDVVGLDAPLGWPDDFVDAIVAHRAFEP